MYRNPLLWKCPFHRVGPTTASMILARMDETEKEFLNDLFEAKLKYVTTRPYWNEQQAKPKLY